MIKLQDSVPTVYFNKSRDFQFILKLFEIALNSSYANSEFALSPTLPILQTNTFKNDIPLETIKLYLGMYGLSSIQLGAGNDKLIAALIYIFPRLLKLKGTIKGVKLLVDTLVYTAIIEESPEYLSENTYKNQISTSWVDSTVPESDGGYLNLFIPEQIDMNIIRELIVPILDYILPAGCDYRIVNILRKTTTLITTFKTSDKAFITTYENSKANYINSVENSSNKVKVPFVSRGTLSKVGSDSSTSDNSDKNEE